MSEKIKKIEHVYYVCPGSHEDGRSCQFCDGGLSACSTCGAFEGMWPDDCPGEQMKADIGDKVYAGKLNYRDGEWREECCKAMRHIHDKDNFMMENGYFQNEQGRWEKYPVAEWVKVL